MPYLHPSSLTPQTSLLLVVVLLPRCNPVMSLCSPGADVSLSLCTESLDLGLVSSPVDPEWISVRVSLDWIIVWIAVSQRVKRSLDPASSPQHCIYVYISPGDTCVNKLIQSPVFESCTRNRDSYADGS